MDHSGMTMILSILVLVAFSATERVSAILFAHLPGAYGPKAGVLEVWK